MKQFIFLVTTFSLLIFGCKDQDQTIQKPNIIFMLADDLGYNDLSLCRTMEPIPEKEIPTSITPSLDQLAQEGITFTNFYCGAAVCSPSRSALLTGRNATRLGIYNWIPPNQPMHLRGSEVTLAEMLKKSGYQTAHIGKWHLAAQGTEQPEPPDQGFDYAFWTHNNAHPSHENPDNFIKMDQEVGKISGYSCQIVADEAINWMKKQNKSHLKISYEQRSISRRICQ
mgnify:CR=1 FL=1